MKRTISILSYVLIVFIAIVPLGIAALSCFGYTFTDFSVSAFAVVDAVLAVCVVQLNAAHENTIKDKAICVLLALVMPLSLVNVFICLQRQSHVLVLISGWVCICCCGYLTIKYAKPMILKIVALIIAGLLALPIGLFSLFAVFFPIGQNTVVKTVESPSGRYYAQVIDSDQGALGGDTTVNVHEKSVINLILLQIEKKPQQVYFGDWGAFKNMKIYWKNDHCIVVNSVEHEIE